MRYLYFASLVLFVFVTPQFSKAEDIGYGKITDSVQDTLLLTYTGFRGDTAFLCSTTNLLCSPSASTTVLYPFSDPTLQEQFKNKEYFFNPQKDRAIVSTNDPQTNLKKYTLNSMQGSTLTPLATLPITESIQRVLWSEDGTRLILLVQSGFIVRYDIATNEFEYVMQHPSSAGWLTLSPNGRYLAYYIPAALSRSERTFGIIDTVQNKTYTTNEDAAYWDLLTEGVRIFSFSPDNKTLLYMSDRDDPQTMYTVTLSSLKGTAFKGTRLLTKNYTIGDFIWRDNSTILFSANRENPLLWSLYSYNVGTNALLKLADNIAYNASMKKMGNFIVFYQIRGNTLNPTLYNMTTKQVGAFLTAGLAVTPAPLGQIVKAGKIYGVYQKPMAPSTSLLVWLHGGPFRQTSNGYHSYQSYAMYDWVLSEATRAGIPVLKLDYPGSYGYGRKFSESVKLNVGVADVRETVAAVNEFAKKNGYKNIYLLGNSYGGYLALKAQFDHPNTFAGAFSVNGVTDWNLLTQRLETSIFNIDFNGLLNGDNALLYDRASLLPKIPALTTQKIILAYGDKDTTVPPDQSPMLHEELTFQKKNAELVVYKDEDHVFKKPETLEALCAKILSFVGANSTGRCKI
jgi:predicted esterase